MTLEPLADASTAEVVAQRIRDAILDGNLRPGDRLI
jgi:DNA-binding GntR family transcriptional regulator